MTTICFMCGNAQENKYLCEKCFSEYLEEGFTIEKYLELSSQLALKSGEITLKAWAKFKGKSDDDEEVLKSKAEALIRYLMQMVHNCTELWPILGSKLGAEEGPINSDAIFLETASAYLTIISRLSRKYLIEEQRKTFTEVLLQIFIDFAVVEKYGEKNDAIEYDFLFDLNNALEAYELLPFFPGNGGGKDALLWEFANNIGKMVGIRKNALFNSMIEHHIIRDIEFLHLKELFEKNQ